MSRISIVAVTVFSIITLISFKNAASQDESGPYGELDVFSSVISIIEHNYVKKIDDRKLIEGSITGMLKTLDPHSAFLTPDDFKMLREDTSGNFCGVGLEVSIKDGVLTVITPIDDSPAQRADIQNGDIIISIENNPTSRMDIEDAVSLMRGEEGTSVTITIVRKGRMKPFDVTLKRAPVNIKSVTSKIIRPGFAYVKITQFTDGVSHKIRLALRDAEDGNGNLKGVVLDLRGNPGGLMYEAVKAADLFIKKGSILITKGRDSKILDIFSAHSTGTFSNLAIVVLINGSSASASEILAGALQDSGVAFIVGTKSFGKGSVQTIIPLRNGYGIKLTTALYYTPKGVSIQAKGIVPDVEIDPLSVNNKNHKESAMLKESDLPGHFLAGKTHDDSTDEAILDIQLKTALYLVQALSRRMNAQR